MMTIRTRDSDEQAIMATLTVRDVPPAVIRALKKLAKRNQRSMQQEVLGLLTGIALDRESALGQLEQASSEQARATTKDEMDRWIRASRP